MRLNLGCGQKRWPGFVNVDIDQGDAHCDISQPLPFSDVDEIHAIHVIEHFWRWTVPEILANWIGVLKPGGMLVLECPCFEKVCTFLHSPKALTALYGNPN